MTNKEARKKNYCVGGMAKWDDLPKNTILDDWYKEISETPETLIVNSFRDECAKAFWLKLIDQGNREKSMGFWRNREKLQNIAAIATTGANLLVDEIELWDKQKAEAEERE